MCGVLSEFREEFLDTRVKRPLRLSDRMRRMRRSQIFALIKEAIALLLYTTKGAYVDIVYSIPGGNWGHLEVSRNAGTSWFDVSDDQAMTISEGPMSRIMRDIQQIVHINSQVVHVALSGPSANIANPEYVHVSLYDDGDQGLCPLPRIRGVS